MSVTAAVKYHNILDTEIEMDGEEYTLRSYILAILKALFDEGEEFSGKRPLGNSDWQFALGCALVKAGILKGTYDEDIDEADFDWQDFDNIIARALEELN